MSVRLEALSCFFLMSSTLFICILCDHTSPEHPLIRKNKRAELRVCEVPHNRFSDVTTACQGGFRHGERKFRRNVGYGIKIAIDYPLSLCAEPRTRPPDGPIMQAGILFSRNTYLHVSSLCYLHDGNVYIEHLRLVAWLVPRLALVIAKLLVEHLSGWEPPFNRHPTPASISGYLRQLFRPCRSSLMILTDSEKELN